MRKCYSELYQTGLHYWINLDCITNVRLGVIFKNELVFLVTCVFNPNIIFFVLILLVTFNFCFSLKNLLELKDGHNESLADITAVINQAIPNCDPFNIHTCLVKTFPDLQAQQSTDSNEIYYLGIQFANNLATEDRVIDWLVVRFRNTLPLLYVVCWSDWRGLLMYCWIWYHLHNFKKRKKHS